MTEWLPTVLFIAKGSVAEGMGHVIRTRTVARAMQQRTATHLAIIGDAYAANLLVNRGIPFTQMADCAEVLSLYRSLQPDVVVFDMLVFEPAAFREINSGCFTASLSPVFNCLPDTDVVFHRTSVLGDDWTAGEGRGPAIRAGLSYAVINDHCKRIPTEIFQHHLNQDMLTVAISMGGSDVANKSLRILETIKAIDEQLLIWVMLGEGYLHSYQALVESVRGSKHEIILAKTTTSMWRVLSTCSLAILAGGTTTYEAAYAGLPSINILESASRRFLIQELVEKGLSLCAGHTLDEALENLNPLVRNLYRHRDRLLAMHRASRDQIDDQGVQRIVERLIEMWRE